MDRRNGHDDRQDLLVDLAQRLLTNIYPGGPRFDSARLLPGEVAGEFPAEVPFPEGGRIIGSLVLSSQVTVVIDTSATPEQLTSFFKNAMAAKGWTEPEPWPHFGRGGFQHNMMQEILGTVFCRGMNSLSLYVRSSPAAITATEARLKYDTDPRMSFCAQQRRQRRHPGGMPKDVIPALSPPPKSTQMPKGGSSQSDGHSETSAYLQSELDLLAVTDHYEAQLAQSGWVTQEAGQDGPMAWRTYKFKDDEGEEWNSVFFVVAIPKKQGEYLLVLEATMEGAEQYPFGGGGMTFFH